MNKWEKEVQESLLDAEEEAIEELEKQYRSALNEINQKVKTFQVDIDMLDALLNQDGLDEAAKALLMSQKRSKIYQKQFQQALKDQVSGILDRMQGKNYGTIEGYLKDCYEDSYVGTLYDLAQQGLPIITPINQASAMQAILLDSKVVEGYYARLGVDIDMLKKTITQEISRGIASSLPYSDIARNIDNVAKTGLFNAKRITRTEGHRIQNTAARDAAKDAVDHGADLVKVWDATLDGKTRPSHRMVDGQIRELDEKFSNGLDRPGDPNGAAEEVINCRCQELHKPRWDAEGGFAKVDNFTGEILTFDKPEDYKQFKDRYFSKENVAYMNYVSKLEQRYGTTNISSLLGQMTEAEYAHFKKLESASPMWNTATAGKQEPASKVITVPAKSSDNDKYNNILGNLQQDGIDYLPVQDAGTARSTDEIIAAIAGGDQTQGSCASVGLAYVGQQKGLDVMDFRDGLSRKWFGSKKNKYDMWDAIGVNPIYQDTAKSNLTNAVKIMSSLIPDHEYYLSVGRHAAVVRCIMDPVIDQITGEVLSEVRKYQYLELQSSFGNGWCNFSKNLKDTFTLRFGCSSSSRYVSTACAVDIADVEVNDEFRTILGFINTSATDQRKGSSGGIK